MFHGPLCICSYKRLAFSDHFRAICLFIITWQALYYNAPFLHKNYVHVFMSYQLLCCSHYRSHYMHRCYALYALWWCSVLTPSSKNIVSLYFPSCFCKRHFHKLKWIFTQNVNCSLDSTLYIRRCRQLQCVSIIRAQTSAKPPLKWRQEWVTPHQTMEYDNIAKSKTQLTHCHLGYVVVNLKV